MKLLKRLGRPKEEEKEIASISIPTRLFNDEKLSGAVRFGFKDRSNLLSCALFCLSELITRYGLEDGCRIFKERLGMK